MSTSTINWSDVTPIDTGLAHNINIIPVNIGRR